MTRTRVSLADTRKSQGFSQAELAERVGVSQATISRLEKEESTPSLQLLAKIAKALELELRDLVEEEDLEVLLGQDGLQQFYCFCPNPLCDSNEIGEEDDEATVTWSSATSYPRNRFEEVNFCTSCGEELVKECRGCGRRLADRGTRYCISCGSRITNRPTDEEWEKIRRIVAQRIDDDIPF